MNGSTDNVYQKGMQWILLLFVAALPWPIPYGIWSLGLTTLWVIPAIVRRPHVSGTQWIASAFFAGYFTLHLLWYLFGQGEGANPFSELEKKLSLLAIPLIMLAMPDEARKRAFDKAKGIYVVSVLLAAITCLLIAVYRYVLSNDPTVFYYHDLCRPIGHHAVYFSCQLLLAFMLIIEQRHTLNPFLLSGILVLFFVVLLLLSSKVILLAGLVWGVYKLFEAKTGRMSLLGVVAGGALLFAIAGQNLMHRMKDLSFRSEIMIRSKFEKADYFDGFSLRLLQMRFGLEILQTQQAWLSGTGPYQAQVLLNNKYASSGMYLGESGKAGYWGLNFHNQYLETGVRFGLTGLIPLLAGMFLLLRKALMQQNKMLLYVTALFAVFFFTESVLETFRGLSLFVFFIFWFIEPTKAA